MIVDLTLLLIEGLESSGCEVDTQGTFTDDGSEEKFRVNYRDRWFTVTVKPEE